MHNGAASPPYLHEYCMLSLCTHSCHPILPPLPLLHACHTAHRLFSFAFYGYLAQSLPNQLTRPIDLLPPGLQARLGRQVVTPVGYDVLDRWVVGGVCVCVGGGRLEGSLCVCVCVCGGGGV